MTKRGANLGCGRLVFPCAQGDPMTDHVSYALDTLCPEAYDLDVQWDNFDKRLEDSQKSRLMGSATLRFLDLFRYPWNIEDNTYDIIWLSHIAEHIPHEPKLDTTFANSGHSLAEQMYFDEFDGWFIFFGECWRILKPGGVLHVLAPYGPSVAGMTDPTHTRYVMPGSFGYFAIDDKAPFDYALPYSFRQINITNKQSIENGAIMKFVGHSSELVDSMNRYLDQFNSLPESGRGAELRAQLKHEIDAVRDTLSSYSLRHFNQIAEFVYSFTPVK